MPKVNLEFNLPEEAEEFELAINAGKMHCVISELDNYLRSKVKYEELTEEQSKIYQEVRDKLWQFKNN